MGVESGQAIGIRIEVSEAAIASWASMQSEARVRAECVADHERCRDQAQVEYDERHVQMAREETRADRENLAAYFMKREKENQERVANILIQGLAVLKEFVKRRVNIDEDDVVEVSGDAELPGASADDFIDPLDPRNAPPPVGE